MVGIKIGKIYDHAAESYKILEYGRNSAYYHKYWIDILLEYVPKDKSEGLKILDYGCGSGMVMKHVIYNINSSLVVGIDISKEMLKIARKRNAGELVLGNVMSCGFKEECFDIIISRGVLYLLNNLEEAIKEINRILKPGGILVISEPNENLILDLIRKVLRLRSSRFSKEHKSIQKKRLIKLLIRNEYYVIDYKHFGFLAFPFAFVDVFKIYKFLPFMMCKILIRIDDIFSKVPYLNTLSWHFIVVARKIKKNTESS